VRPAHRSGSQVREGIDQTVSNLRERTIASKAALVLCRSSATGLRAFGQLRVGGDGPAGNEGLRASQHPTEILGSWQKVGSGFP
jgi:hypothetical protein